MSCCSRDRPPGPYRYSPLAQDSNQIRLLRLRPALYRSAPIKCSLLPCFLGEAPQYDALSYTWGDQDDKSPIFLDGAEFWVTQNLDSALRYLRRKSYPILCWIDALCIDQSNSEERAQQVSLMRDIFSQARLVRAWLGLADEDAANGIRFLEAVAREFGRNNFEFTDSLIAWINNDVSRGSTDRGWSSLSRILMRPWWVRVWVLQEVAVAKQTWVMYGKKMTPLENFIAAKNVILAKYLHRFNAMEAAVAMLNKGAEKQAVFYLGNAFTALNRFSDAVANEETKSDFYECLRKFRSFQSSDPRDKVYALLGVISDRTLPEISVFQPNYGITGSELYIKVASYYLHDQNMLEILHDCQGPSTTPGLPSWVPDWSTDLVLESMLYLQMGTDDRFEASTQRNSSFSLLDSENVLAVDGLHFDIIEGLGNQMDSEIMTQPGSDSIAYSNDIFTNWLCTGLGLDEPPVDNSLMLMEVHSPTAHVPASALQYFNAPYVGGGTKFEAWRRTLLFNKHGPLESYSHQLAETFHMDASITQGMRAGMCSRNRRFCLSSKGYMGLVPPQSVNGDIICLLFGLATPFILRQQENGYIVIGDCYIQGLMDGEAIKQLEDGVIDITRFRLI